MWAPRQPLLGDFEPCDAEKRQSGPCRVAWPPRFLRDKRGLKGVTRLPRATSAVGEKSPVPQQSAESFPSSPHSGLHSRPYQGSEGHYSCWTELPLSTPGTGGQVESATQRTNLDSLEGPPLELRVRVAPRSLGSGAPGMGDHKPQSPSPQLSRGCKLRKALPWKTLPEQVSTLPRK